MGKNLVFSFDSGMISVISDIFIGESQLRKQILGNFKNSLKPLDNDAKSKWKV